MPSGVFERKLKPLAERLMSKVEIAPNGCWLWTASLDHKGYGQINFGIRGAGVGKAHRESWKIHHGSIPEKLEVCHRCDVPRCINPDHLFLGTHADNMRDCREKGRQPTGLNRKHTKLSDDDVLDIAISNVHYKDLARQYAVDDETVRRITTGVCPRLHRILKREIPAAADGLT